MQRKAKAGHVTGGRVFGYDNVNVLAADGSRSHVERRINEAEADIVCRIFRLSADGRGLTSIAKLLNTEGAVSPRSQQGRPRSWAPSSVREVLHRDLYRGEIVWNRTRKRNAWGQVQQRERGSAEWIRIPAPELRIVPDELWAAAHERISRIRASYLRGTDGRLWGRPLRGNDSKYLLPGLVRCGLCNGSMYVKSRKGTSGKARSFFYGCTSYHQRGHSACSNSLELPMELADRIVLEAFRRDNPAAGCDRGGSGAGGAAARPGQRWAGRRSRTAEGRPPRCRGGALAAHQCDCGWRGRAPRWLWRSRSERPPEPR
jgi:site-specific DNA recombinase